MLCYITQKYRISMSRSQTNIDQGLDYRMLYLQQKQLKEQLQRKVQVSELKLRKLAQSINKKCIRCAQIEGNISLEDNIRELKKFKCQFSRKDVGYSHKTIPNKNQAIIENFAIFGVPQSILGDPAEWEQSMDGQILYISDMPTDTVMHSARLAFPAGQSPKYYSGTAARQKSIQIISSSYSYLKSYIMSYQCPEQISNNCEVQKLMNPQSRLYAICLAVEDFTLIPFLDTRFIQSQKLVRQQKQQNYQITSKSCEQTDTSFTGNQCHIATSSRVYCIFSRYPFFHFYEELLKSIVNTVKTERLVIYRQSGCSLAEADSRFFIERTKQTYRTLSQQIQNWALKLNKQYQVKLLTCQKLSLYLEPISCEYNFVQEWCLPVLNCFTVDSFLDVLVLMMLEQKIVFVSENPNILTYAIHFFTRLLVRPLKYPYPTVSLLPQTEEYLNSPFPVVYGLLLSKKSLLEKKFVHHYKNVYVCLSKMGTEILSAEPKKNILKNKPIKLRNLLSNMFKNSSGMNHRTSALTFTDGEGEYQRDKSGFCLEVLKTVNKYLAQHVIAHLPSAEQISQLKSQELSKGLTPGKDLNQQVYKTILKRCNNSTQNNPFLSALLQTQLINVYLFE